MEPLQAKELRIQAADDLGDLMALMSDLDFVVKTVQRLYALLEQPEQDGVSVRAFYVAALISYARCFADGKRWKLEPSIFAHFEGEPLVVHRQFIDTRNKHVAHSVNGFEITKVGVFLNPEGTEVLGVGQLNASLVSWDLEGLKNLEGLASIARSFLVEAAKKLEAKVLEHARALSPEALAALPPLRITPQGGPEAARTARRTAPPGASQK